MEKGKAEGRHRWEASRFIAEGRGAKRLDLALDGVELEVSVIGWDSVRGIPCVSASGLQINVIRMPERLTRAHEECWCGQDHPSIPARR